MDSFFFNSITNTGVASSPPQSADDMIRAMQDFERRFPKRDLPTAVRAGGSVFLPLMTMMAKKTQSFAPLTGLPVRFDETLEMHCYAIEYADGEEEIYCGNRLLCRRPIKRKEVT